MIEFDKMYAEFDEWKKTQEAFACVQDSDFAQVWMTAYRAGEKAENEACAKLCEKEIAIHGDYFSDKIRERNNKTS